MKKNAVFCAPKAQPYKKNKLKSKHKSKEKRFNVDQYLDSVMVGMHEHSTETVRKRKLSATKRQLSSALARTTPHSERTASSSKIRCKSSYSQYRKKSVTIREGMHLNLDKIVTEQDVINFTEVTARGKEDNSSPPTVKLMPMSKSAAARKIQRAWRNYQTKKVVSKYFEQICFKMKKDKELKKQVVENSTYEEQTVKKQAKRTLKIRKQDKKASPLTVNKVPKALFKSIQSEDQIERIYSSQGNQTRTIEFKQAQQQLIDRQLPSSLQLQSIVEILRISHETASKQIEGHFNNLCAVNNSLPIYSESNEQIEQERGSSIFKQKKSSFAQLQSISPIVFVQMENSIKQKYNLLQNRLQEKVKLRLINDEQRLKAYQQLQGRMLREIRVLNHCKEQYTKSILQLKEQMLKMQNDNALVAKLQGRIGYRVRRSYSAQSLLMKEILQEVTNKNVDLEKPFIGDQTQVILQYNFRKKKKEEGVGLSFPTSPPSVVGGSNQKLANSGQSLACYELNSELKLRQELCNSQIRDIQIMSPQNLQFNEFENNDSQLSQGLQREVLKCDSIQSLNVSLPQNSFRQQDNSRLIRQCSEEIQEQIEALLIQQITEQIYESEYFWKYFRPYIQKPFQFKPIEDHQIRQFLVKDLPNYFPPQSQLIERINQKINPTTLQILRLIRDVQFQIEEYDLVLPEQVFKKYRKYVEQIYSHRLIAQQQKNYDLQLMPNHLKTLAKQRSIQKQQKVVRFIKFQRDIRIMYMKSIFNSFNEVIIQNKSNYTFMNGRSSIGPGELTLAIKQYNWNCQNNQLHIFLDQARQKILITISNKCGLPQFKTHRDLQIFQNQFNKQLSNQLEQNEYKWVNYMDQVMQIWQDLSLSLVQMLFDEAANEISHLF